MYAYNISLPFSWAERHVLIKDRMWHVPDCCNYEKFTFPGWQHHDLFGNDRPVNVEYCSGNGEWIASKAAAHPHFNWIAIEKKFMRAKKIWARIKRLNLTNVIVLCGEGYNATVHYFPANSVNAIYINFPDPWPKTKHIKHRIIQPPFIRELNRILHPKASLTFVTDDPAYSEWTIRTVQENLEFENHFPDPFYATTFEEYGTSYFEQMWRQKGKEIRYHRFCKK